MRLIELEPRWINETMFAFRCPHCRNTWLTCKITAMSHDEQMKLLRDANLEPTGPRYGSVMTVPDCAWVLKGGNRDFATMSVTPSIDASAAGHWHGHITNGAIA